MPKALASASSAMLLLGLVACSGSATSIAAPEADSGVMATPPPSPDGGGDGGSAEAGSPPTSPCAPGPVVRETFASFEESGTTTRYRLTARPRGIVVALHGTGGSSRSLVEESVEWASFFHDAAAREHVLVVPESLERTPPRQWDAQSPNGDTPHIARILERLERGGLAADLPIYVVGMSQGGGAAPIVGALLAKDGRPVRAVSVYCAGASSVFERPDYTLPTVFSLMANDSVMTENARVAELSRGLAARGVATDLSVAEAAPICPEAFTRIPGVDAAASRAISADLRAAGVLAEDGRVVAPTREIDVATLLPAYASLARPIEEQLRVAAAEHTFYAARNEATLSFFDAHR